MKTILSYNQATRLANEMYKKILDQVSFDGFEPGQVLAVYAVPRGGVPAALLMRDTTFYSLVDDPMKADVIVDDIIDSGETRNRYKEAFFDKPFLALIDKTAGEYADQWVVFPWEVDANGQDTSGHDIGVRLLQLIGEDPERDGLKETPARFAKAWAEWSEGYQMNPADYIKVFQETPKKHEQMVIVKDLPVYSKCEHHLADIIGTVSIGYIPQEGRILGLSKLPRLANVFSRRLQVQERLTEQIADALFSSDLKPAGVGVRMQARHMCMESRGVKLHGHHTVTTALKGLMLENDAAHAEFMAEVRT